MKDSRKHGCFHVVGAANASEALQKLGKSPVIAIAEGYATATTVAKYGNVPAIAAFDSGNLRQAEPNLPPRHMMIMPQLVVRDSSGTGGEATSGSAPNGT